MLTFSSQKYIINVNIIIQSKSFVHSLFVIQVKYKNLYDYIYKQDNNNYISEILIGETTYSACNK